MSELMQAITGGGGQTAPAGGAAPPPGATAPAPPGPTPPKKSGFMNSPLAEVGVPLAAGVLSAMSPTAARGVHGALTAGQMFLNKDPYGYKALGALTREQSLEASKQNVADKQKKDELADEERDQVKRLRDHLTEEFPNETKIIATLPDKDVYSYASKAMEKPTFNELGLKGQSLGFGSDPRRWSLEASKQIDASVKQDKLDQAKAQREQARQIQINMPLPSRATGGPAGLVYTIDAQGNAVPVTGPNGQPITAKGNKLVTGTTVPERQETGKEKKEMTEEQRRAQEDKDVRTTARNNLRDNLQYKLLPPAKQAEMRKNEEDRIRQERGTTQPAAPGGGGKYTLPSAADPAKRIPATKAEYDAYVAKYGVPQ